MNPTLLIASVVSHVLEQQRMVLQRQLPYSLKLSIAEKIGKTLFAKVFTWVEPGFVCMGMILGMQNSVKGLARELECKNLSWQALFVHYICSVLTIDFWSSSG